jgi:hypothetical protein
LPEHQLSFRIIWSDQDLLDVETSIAFAPWAGVDRAYATRSDLTAFADSLDQVAAGSAEAELALGQPDLGYASCRLFEYGGPRHLAMDVVVGCGAGGTGQSADHGREIRVSVPIERGQLSALAASIRTIVADEDGIAVLPLPPGWP